ncbi:MgtC/SapB family protein [Sediminibacterium sp.]|uniref:MgtC/SapB family protein n=1 Tax=Sediminibacterium sp. TaxID=1917865 RepID=UPI002735750E|nr:MgtC/SapB family protein [Sediminibacterium sp.]MDP3393514.1 MgtC/SapB family protein [Sediminibacterium sp.]MDP3566715.1 MgtC/SapB family protein [Sediminibacterium sp.]
MHELLNTIFSPFILSLIVSAGVGLIIGLEREFDILSGNEHFAGLRTFVLVAILGCVVTYLATEFNFNILLVTIPSIFLFISVFHFSKVRKENFGLVTEFSLLLVFFLGVLASLHLIKEALAIAVITATLLTFKNKFKATVKQITQEELYAFIRFAIISLLILPYLPNESFGPAELINPQSIGFVIVIVSSLSFVGYFIIKFFGAEKGIMFTAFFGGTFSSTAVTWIFSTKSKENTNLSLQYAAGILIACAVMFVRVTLVAALFNIEVFKWLLIPCLLMAGSSVGYAYYILRTKASNSASLGENIQLGNPLDLINAAMFGLQYIAITLIVYYANESLGTKGLFISGIISGLADVDAINISASKLSLVQITPAMAAIVILLAVISNTFFKMGECILKGTAVLRKQVVIALIPAIIIAFISISIIYINQST